MGSCNLVSLKKKIAWAYSFYSHLKNRQVGLIIVPHKEIQQAGEDSVVYLY